MMDQNFEIRIVIFENFLKFSKRCHTVPLWLIWTIMVAAKLDQSGVLVTKFRQNRLTLKDRSAGQRHTDKQTRLKIRPFRFAIGPKMKINGRTVELSDWPNSH